MVWVSSSNKSSTVDFVQTDWYPLKLLKVMMRNIIHKVLETNHKNKYREVPNTEGSLNVRFP